MKKILCIFLAIVMLFAMTVTASATEISEDTAAKINELEIPVVYFSSLSEYEQYLTTIGEDVNKNGSGLKGATVISAAVIRNGTTDECELYLNWTGDELYSGFRFKKMEVKSTSILFGTTYGTFGNGSSYTYRYVVAATIGSVKVGDVTIDSDVERVKVTCKDLQGYNLITASWLSAVELTGTVTIN